MSQRVTRLIMTGPACVKLAQADTEELRPEVSMLGQL